MKPTSNDSVRPQSPDTDPHDPFYGTNSTSSATELTGLTYRPPEDEEEAENYARLYAIHRQKPIN